MEGRKKEKKEGRFGSTDMTQFKVEVHQLCEKKKFLHDFRVVCSLLILSERKIIYICVCVCAGDRKGLLE